MYIKIGKFEMEMSFLGAAIGATLIAGVANNCLRVVNNKYRCKMAEILSQPIKEKEDEES